MSMLLMTRVLEEWHSLANACDRPRLWRRRLIGDCWLCRCVERAVSKRSQLSGKKSSQVEYVALCVLPVEGFVRVVCSLRDAVYKRER